MRQNRVLGISLSALVATVLLAGCTAQDPEVSEESPSPSSTENQQSSPPTGATSTAITEPISGTYTGDQTFELGTPPSEATHIHVELTCLSPGILFLPDGAEMDCTDQTTEQGPTGTWSLPLSKDQDSVEVRTSEAELSYEVEMAYESK